MVPIREACLVELDVACCEGCAVSVAKQYIPLLVHCITYKGTDVSFRIKLRTLLIWNVCIGTAAEGSEMSDVRSCSDPQLEGGRPTCGV